MGVPRHVRRPGGAAHGNVWAVRERTGGGLAGGLQCRWGPSTRRCVLWWIREALEPQRGGTRQDDANRLCWLGLAPVAQLAEQRTFNPWVLGSSPSGGTRIFDASGDDSVLGGS